MTTKPVLTLLMASVLAWLDTRWLLGALIVLNVAALLAMYSYVRWYFDNHR